MWPSSLPPHKASPVGLAAHKQRRAELAVLEIDENHVLRGLAMMLLEPAGRKGVHVVLNGQRATAGGFQQRRKGRHVLIGKSRRQEDSPGGRVDKTGRTQPHEKGLFVGEFVEQALDHGDRVGRRGDAARVEPPQGLAAQVQAAGLHVPRANRSADHVQSIRVDGHGNPRAPRAIGLGRVLPQKALFQQLGYV